MTRSEKTPDESAKANAPSGHKAVLPTRILVPLDFSGKSRQALDVAIPLAQQYEGRIFLIHVVEPVYAYPSYPEGVGTGTPDLEPAVMAANARLTDMARQLVPSNLMGQCLVRVGRAYAEIIEAAGEIDADLIVIATHGHTGLKHVFLGSTAEHVVRQAACSVLTVRRT